MKPWQFIPVSGPQNLYPAEQEYFLQLQLHVDALRASLPPSVE